LGKLNERKHLEDLNVDGRVYLKNCMEEIGQRGGWIHLAQDR